MELTKILWGNYEGKDIYLFKLTNDSMEVGITNFGATITAIITPDKNGQSTNVVLGYDTLQEYIDNPYYLGCIVGRITGRIANAAFNINGITYQLTKNDNDNSLHGGSKGLSKQVFTVVSEAADADKASVKFHYHSPHLEEGYPGNLDVWVSYELSANNQLTIKYKAQTDADTHVNLTNHSYFNLGGKGESPTDNELFIDADSYVETLPNFIPTGRINTLRNTPYDFKALRAIGAKVCNECYVLNNTAGVPNAILSDNVSGRKLSVATDMPSILLYTGDYLGGKFAPRDGVCLETQFYPDSPNHANFPITLLKAGDVWESYTRFSFGWD
jgi:aldose 1-epimerase